MKTRRRWLREETVAPWLTVTVIVAVWWAGAALIPRTGTGASGPVTESSKSPSADRGPGPDARASVARDVSSASRVAMVPVAGIEASSLTSSFNEVRGGGARRHEAMDILAPRGTPVMAAVEGRVVKLFTSAAGGLTIYQFDADERLCFYYAHLDAYAPDLTEGENVVQGQVIGYVGTTGNAPPGTPHLHFAIYRLGADKRWWDGEPLDPLTFLR